MIFCAIISVTIVGILSWKFLKVFVASILSINREKIVIVFYAKENSDNHMLLYRPALVCGSVTFTASYTALAYGIIVISHMRVDPNGHSHF